MEDVKGFSPAYGISTQYDFSPAIANCNVTYNSSTGNVAVNITGC